MKTQHLHQLMVLQQELEVSSLDIWVIFIFYLYLANVFENIYLSFPFLIMTTLDECVDSTECPPGQTCQLFVDSGARCADDTEAPTEVPAEGASDTTPALEAEAAGAGG